MDGTLAYEGFSISIHKRKTLRVAASKDHAHQNQRIIDQHAIWVKHWIKTNHTSIAIRVKQWIKTNNP